MTTLLVAEHNNKVLKDATSKALTAAKALGGDVHVLVAGKDCKEVADLAAKLDGVKKVLLADAALYQHSVAEPLAALIDVMQISEIIKVIAPDTFERPIYAGNAIQTVKSSDAKKVITVRTSTL